MDSHGSAGLKAHTPLPSAKRKKWSWREGKQKLFSVQEIYSSFFPKLQIVYVSRVYVSSGVARDIEDTGSCYFSGVAEK